MTQNSSIVRAARVFALMLTLATAVGACRGDEGPAGPAGPTGPTGPAGSGGTPEFFIALGTGPLVADENVIAYTQVPGLSLAVGVPAGASGQVLIETDGGIQLNSDAPVESCFIDVAIFVDGNQVGAGRRATVVNNAAVIFSVGTYGFSVQTGLTPGLHTIAVMAKRFTPTFAPCYVSSGAAGSGLPGNPRLQGTLNIVSFH